jgi:hypothetical protein
LKGSVSLWRLAVTAYAFPAFLAIGAILPTSNFVLYTGHGGPGWLLLLFGFPSTLSVLTYSYFLATDDERPKVRRFAALSLLAYLPLSYGASYAGAHSIQRSFGLEIAPRVLWGFFLFPFSLIALLF